MGLDLKISSVVVELVRIGQYLCISRPIFTLWGLYGSTQMKRLSRFACSLGWSVLNRSIDDADVKKVVLSRLWCLKSSHAGVKIHTSVGLTCGCC